MRKCLYCKKPFEARTQKKIYCSTKCCDAMNKGRVRIENKEVTRNLKASKPNKKDIAILDDGDWLDYSGFC